MERKTKYYWSIKKMEQMLEKYGGKKQYKLKESWSDKCNGVIYNKRDGSGYLSIRPGYDRKTDQQCVYISVGPPDGRITKTDIYLEWPEYDLIEFNRTVYPGKGGGA